MAAYVSLLAEEPDDCLLDNEWESDTKSLLPAPDTRKRRQANSSASSVSREINESSVGQDDDRDSTSGETGETSLGSALSATKKCLCHVLNNVSSCCSSRRFCCTGLLGFLGILCLTGGVAIFFSFRSIVEFIISKNVVLAPNSDVFNMWKAPPIPIYLNVYLFNITRKEDFPWRYRKPEVQELGPYVYREEWKKVDFRWHSNGTVSYRRIRTFHFEPKLSNGTEDDVVTTVNIPVLAAAYLFKSAGPLVKLAMTTVFHVLHESFIIRRSVRELLFEGYDDPLIKVAREIFGSYPFNKFGYLYGQNATDDGVYTVYTGDQDVDKFTLIDTWKGQRQMDMWSSPYCNTVNGTDGGSFPPLIEESRNLEIFVSDFCRSIELEYVNSEDVYGVHSLHYEPIKNMLDNGTLVPGNECYCAGQCLKSGVFNISQCKFGAPAFVSYPHFLEADPSYLDAVLGMKPNPDLHKTHVYVEPLTGLPMQMNVKFQLNAFIENIPDFSLFDKLPTMLFPLMWFDETFQMTTEILDQVKFASTAPYLYGKVVIYSLLGVGVILILSAVIYFLVGRRRDRVAALTSETFPK